MCGCILKSNENNRWWQKCTFRYHQACVKTVGFFVRYIFLYPYANGFSKTRGTIMYFFFFFFCCCLFHNWIMGASRSNPIARTPYPYIWRANSHYILCGIRITLLRAHSTRGMRRGRATHSPTLPHAWGSYHTTCVVWLTVTCLHCWHNVPCLPEPPRAHKWTSCHCVCVCVSRLAHLFSQASNVHTFPDCITGRKGKEMEKGKWKNVRQGCASPVR